MSESDRDYYRRRVAQELSAANQSPCDRIKGVHEALAGLYSERLDLLLSNCAQAADSNVVRLDPSASAVPLATRTARNTSTSGA